MHQNRAKINHSAPEITLSASDDSAPAYYRIVNDGDLGWTHGVAHKGLLRINAIDFDRVVIASVNPVAGKAMRCSRSSLFMKAMGSSM